ncbi:MAG: phosphopentomutase [Balneolaceae bacterium]|nr:phosphopentomutase [Balneolaceae bacterium]MBO6547078.1 phosphopentomutase [Balneolaceae bacterium]MBO6647975.1 phosphopentomutase [Balneolaceae bacterium]
MGNCYLIIIDGLGVGAQEDADLYGDTGMNTLGHVSEKTRVELPNLAKMGIGNIIPLVSIPEEQNPIAAFGKMREVSGGKDSTTGHWEIAGIQLEKPFPTYPNGFPKEVINTFCEGIGVDGVLCNLPYSGTDVIRDYGKEHLKTGKPIVYTSADSVFQLATHDDLTSVEQLYEWCEFARKKVCIGEHEVGRVIARPFTGVHPFDRISDKRHDFSAIPPKNNVVQQLYDAGIPTYSIGKIIDLFAEKGFSKFERTKNNAEGIQTLLSVMDEVKETFVFVNLIDTDQLFGHRLDPEGFAGSLKEFDGALPQILSKVKEDDLLIITGDHGNDPCSESTDHSREFVPLLVYPKVRAVSEDLGTRGTFADVAASIASFFHQVNHSKAQSFL